MTVDELKDYFTMLSDHGHGNAHVTVANKSWNPVTESDDIVGALVIEWKDAESAVVLQTD